MRVRGAPSLTQRTQLRRAPSAQNEVYHQHESYFRFSSSGFPRQARAVRTHGTGGYIHEKSSRVLDTPPCAKEEGRSGRSREKLVTCSAICEGRYGRSRSSAPPSPARRTSCTLQPAPPDSHSSITTFSCFLSDIFSDKILLIRVAQIEKSTR